MRAWKAFRANFFGNLKIPSRGNSWRKLVGCLATRRWSRRDWRSVSRRATVVTITKSRTGGRSPSLELSCCHLFVGSRSERRGTKIWPNGLVTHRVRCLTCQLQKTFKAAAAAAAAQTVRKRQTFHRCIDPHRTDMTNCIIDKATGSLVNGKTENAEVKKENRFAHRRLFFSHSSGLVTRCSEYLTTLRF